MNYINFNKLVNKICKATNKPKETYDSILVDIQSFIISSIKESLQELDEENYIQQICISTWYKLKKSLQTILRYNESNILPIVVISFDGKTVQMRFRKKYLFKSLVSKKPFLINALFQSQHLSSCIRKYLIFRLKEFKNFKKPKILKVYYSSPFVFGKSTLKLFQFAENNTLRQPIVVSEDEEIYLICLARRRRYDNIQILFRNNTYFNIKEFENNCIGVEIQSIEVVSFLFGNDFIPPVVKIMESTINYIFYSIALMYDNQYEDKREIFYDDSDESTVSDIDDDMPAIWMSRFFTNMNTQTKKNCKTSTVSKLMLSFWMTYLWVQDYYRHDSLFAQKLMKNRICNQFNREKIITALKDVNYSIRMLRKAIKEYNSIRLPTINK